MQESIISGLISGVTVAILIVLVRNFWNAVIVPWFEERVYKDAYIEGKWFGLYPTSTDLRQDVISLTRHGHSVEGTMICVKGADEGDEYSISGSFRNMILPLSYESKDKKKTDRGTITLSCVRNGERLKGKIAFYDSADDSIESANILWFRSREDLEKVVKNIEERKEEMKRIREETERLEKEETEIEDNDEVIEGEFEASAEANKSSQSDADKAGTAA